MERGRLPPKGSIGGPPRLQDLLAPCFRAVFGLLGVRGVRSRSGAERVATALPTRGGLRCFLGPQLWK